MLTKNLKTSLQDSEFYKLSGLRPHREKELMSPKTSFKISSVGIMLSIALWVSGLGFITWMVVKTAY